MNNTLICFFGWGRKAFVEKCLPKAIINKRKQDRLLVIDQEMHNFDIYNKYKEDIDYLVFFKRNYFIGPVWSFFRRFIQWLGDNKFLGGNEGWQPDYICILESDAFIDDFLLDKLLPLFEEYKDWRPVVATGYFGEKDPNERIIKKFENGVIIKPAVHGVNVLVRIKDFLKVKDYPKFTQDMYFSDKITGGIKNVVCKPFLVIHLGDDYRRKAGFFK